MSSASTKEDIMQGQVLLAAQRLFQKSGLHKVTMDDVAKAVGKGRSSLYYYYKSKEEILEAVIGMEIGEIMAEIAKAVQHEHAIQDKVLVFCLTKLQISKKRRALYKTMDQGLDAEGLSSFTQLSHTIHRRFIKLQNTLLRQLLSDAIAQGELRNMDQQEIDLRIFLLLASLSGIKREMKIENDFSMLEPTVTALVRLHIAGMKQ